MKNNIKKFKIIFLILFVTVIITGLDSSFIYSKEFNRNIVPDAVTAENICKIIINESIGIENDKLRISCSSVKHFWKCNIKTIESNENISLYIKKKDCTIIKYKKNNKKLQFKMKSTKNIIKFAEVIWLPIYGKEIYNETPFKIEDAKKYWIVRGTLKPNYIGGVVFIKFDKGVCKVYELFHGE